MMHEYDLSINMLRGTCFEAGRLVIERGGQAKKLASINVRSVMLAG